MWLADTTYLKEALSMTPIYLRFTGNVHDYKVGTRLGGTVSLLLERRGTYIYLRFTGNVHDYKVRPGSCSLLLQKALIGCGSRCCQGTDGAAAPPRCEVVEQAQHDACIPY
jgi:hypothetical protein